MAGTVGALLAVGLVTERDVQGALDDARPADELDPAAGERAAELLERLVDAVVEQGEDEGMAGYRFDGALEALAAVGVADREVWDRRLRERTGRITAAEEWELVRRRNVGGTEQELVAIVPRGGRTVDGARMLYAWWFADGISLTLCRAGLSRFLRSGGRRPATRTRDSASGSSASRSLVDRITRDRTWVKSGNARTAIGQPLGVFSQRCLMYASARP